MARRRIGGRSNRPGAVRSGGGPGAIPMRTSGSPLTNPYFISLSKQMRLCPRCGAKTRIAGTLNGDVAKELCDECGYFRGLLAPGWAMGKRVEEAHTSSPFTVIDGGGR